MVLELIAWISVCGKGPRTRGVIVLLLPMVTPVGCRRQAVSLPLLGTFLPKVTVRLSIFAHESDRPVSLSIPALLDTENSSALL